MQDTVCHMPPQLYSPSMFSASIELNYQICRVSGFAYDDYFELHIHSSSTLAMATHSVDTATRLAAAQQNRRYTPNNYLRKTSKSIVSGIS